MKKRQSTKLTQQSLTAIRKLAKGRDDLTLWDNGTRGFCLRLRNDKLSWAFQYQFEHKDYRIRIGDADALDAATAREKAKDLAGQVARAKIGHDVHPAHERQAAREAQQQPKAPASSPGAIIERYLSTRKDLRESSLHETKRYLMDTWKVLHSIPPDKVSRADVAVELTRIEKDSGAASANRARSTLSKFFKWAIGEGICEDNPVAGTNKRAENGSRDRTLSDAEIVAVWQAVNGGDYGCIVKVCLLTGCRREEIGGLKWSEIDLEKRTITLPGERTKNHQTHVVPLVDAAFDILSGLERKGEFPFGRKANKGFSGWSKSKKDLDATVKLEPWTLHDLRRTVRTGLSKLGVLPHVAEAVLNHQPEKLIRTYDRHDFETEKRKALDTWAHHLRTIVAQTSEANVRKLHARRSPNA